MNRIVLASLACAALVAGSSIMNAETVDFTTVAYGTPVSNQYPGVVFSLMNPSGTPAIGAFGDQALGNSTTGAYPTSDILDIAFTSPVSGVSFTFDNYGDNPSGGFPPSTFTAFDGAVVVDTGDISADNSYSTVINVTGSGITDLQLNNGSDGSYSWLFGVGEITFTPSSVTPEPDSFLLMGSGLLTMAGMLRRKFLKN